MTIHNLNNMLSAGAKRAILKYTGATKFLFTYSEWSNRFGLKFYGNKVSQDKHDRVYNYILKTTKADMQLISVLETYPQVNINGNKIVEIKRPLRHII